MPTPCQTNRLCQGVVAHPVKFTEGGSADTHNTKQTVARWCSRITLVQFLSHESGY